MKLLKNTGDKRVRIIIGECRLGSQGVEKPIKTITLVDTDVLEVEKIILRAIKNESKIN